MTAPSRVRPAETGHSAFTRRTLVKGAAWATPVAAFSLSAPAMALSQLDCQPGDLFDGVGRGRILTGNALFLDLDEDRTQGVELLTLNGVTAQNPGGGAPGPSPDVPVEDRQDNNLSVTALDLVNVDLNGATPPLSQILELTADVDTGVYSQFGHVHQDGTQRGASGYLLDSGAINFEGQPDGSMPQFGRIDLRQILESSLLRPLPLVTPLLDSATGVDALSLEMGAIAGSAEQLQNCEAGSGATLERDYLVSDLKAIVSPADESLLGGLIGEVADGAVGLDLDLTGLTGTLDSLLLSLPILGSLVQVSPAQIAFEVDLAPVTDTPLPSADGTPTPSSIPIQIDFGGDTVTVDLADLVGGLNNALPNAVLFRDLGTQPTVENLTGFLDALVQQLTERLLESIEVTVTAGVYLLLVVDGTLTIRGTLKQLRDGGATVSLAGINLSPITEGLTDAVFNLVYGALSAALSEGGALKQILVDGLLTNLLEPVLAVLADVVHIRLNAQNRPEANEPATGGFAAPSYFDDLEWNRFDVAALHISAVNALSVLNLLLARGSVGPTQLRA
ncbi:MULTISPECIES: choice-of-anchor G family protein [Brachybacterium]|uniref:choice-of-anchor G family protein n=1 Tax=Brachybacterium TaxID=43668 RepID=UPI0021A46A2E|nr:MULTISPECIES: choice-of-anchor G family protein [Brachybacterium]MCT1909563.1 choice-of-anchor G family protein [Brachybacterium paraconglomeratum]